MHYPVFYIIAICILTRFCETQCELYRCNNITDNKCIEYLFGETSEVDAAVDDKDNISEPVSSRKRAINVLTESKGKGIDPRIDYRGIRSPGTRDYDASFNDDPRAGPLRPGGRKPHPQPGNRGGPTETDRRTLPGKPFMGV